MTDNVKKVTQRIAETAKRTAIRYSPIFEGIVQSRNPDGTLNVDPGNGGCTRVVGPKNARVGDRVRIGAEPIVGTITRGAQYNTPLSPSNKPCPRLPDTPAIPTLAVSGKQRSIRTVTDNWETRGEDLGAQGVGQTYNFTILASVGPFSCQAIFEDDASATDTTDVYENWRAFLAFDPPDLPPGAVVSWASISIPLTGATSTAKGSASDSDASTGYHSPSMEAELLSRSICVVRSFGFPTTTAEIVNADMSEILGSLTVKEIRRAYLAVVNDPRAEFIIGPFDPTGEINFALVTDFDFYGVPPPTIRTIPFVQFGNSQILVAGDTYPSGFSPAELTVYYVLPPN